MSASADASGGLGDLERRRLARDLSAAASRKIVEALEGREVSIFLFAALELRLEAMCSALNAEGGPFQESPLDPSDDESIVAVLLGMAESGIDDYERLAALPRWRRRLVGWLGR